MDQCVAAANTFEEIDKGQRLSVKDILLENARGHAGLKHSFIRIGPVITGVNLESSLETKSKVRLILPRENFRGGCTVYQKGFDKVKNRALRNAVLGFTPPPYSILQTHSS
jgi:hypothetical protein